MTRMETVFAMNLKFQAVQLRGLVSIPLQQKMTALVKLEDALFLLLYLLAITIQMQTS